MNITRLLVPSTIVLLVLAGCSKPAPEDNSTQAKDGIAEDAAVVAELNAPIAPADIDVAYKMVSGPTYDAATDLVSYQVEVTNSGRATLVSAGTMPVNFGVAIWDSNRSLKQSPPANQDYARISLPNRLASGKSVVLPVTFEVGPTLGGIVVLRGADGRNTRIKLFDLEEGALFKKFGFQDEVHARELPPPVPAAQPR